MRRVLILFLLTPLLSGCLGSSPTEIALLVADSSGAGPQVVDVDAFEKRVSQACEGCTVTVHDAGGDASEQKNQGRQARAEASVVVVEPVEPGAAKSLVGQDIPVVSLGTVVPGSRHFVGFEAGTADLGSGRSSVRSDLARARDVILGKRDAMTYVPATTISERAADVAVALVADQPLDGAVEHEGVPSWLFEPVEVTLDNLTTALVGGGVLTIDELCEGATAERCELLGLR